MQESHPQAVPYAAAVIDPEVVEVSGAVDEGIEHGLATAEATDQADVAYTQQGASAAAEPLQPAEMTGNTLEIKHDAATMSAGQETIADNRSSVQVDTHTWD